MCPFLSSFPLALGTMTEHEYAHLPKMRKKFSMDCPGAGAEASFPLLKGEGIILMISEFEYLPALVSHRHSAAPNTGLCNLGESHPLLCWANHLRKKGNSLCLPQPALSRSSLISCHTPPSRNTQALGSQWSWKPMLRAQLLQQQHSSNSLVSCPLPSAALKPCPALPSNTSATLPISATHHTTCLIPDTSCSSDLTRQHSSSRSKYHNWWHDHNIRQHSGHATLEET